MSYQNQKNNDALELSDKQTYDKKKISLKESKSFLGIILKYMKIHKKW
ncbi:Uncharacterised protein, partial [Mycoplasma putrefaciens]